MPSGGRKAFARRGIARVDIAAAVAIGGHEPAWLSGHRRQTPVVSLHQVGVDGLVRQVDEERLFRRAVDESLDVVGQEIGRIAGGVHALPIDVQRRIDGFPWPGRATQ